MKKKLITALFLGFSLISINSQSSHAYKDNSNHFAAISDNKNLVKSTVEEMNFSDFNIKNLNINGTKIATEAQNDLEAPSMTLMNGGGYAMKYTFYATEDKNFVWGKEPPPTALTGTLIIGKGKVFTWSNSIKKVFLKVQAVGRRSYFIDRVLEPSRTTCFSTWGTVFSPQYNTDGVCKPSKRFDPLLRPKTF
ncbi:MAG: hypothetical protein MH252_02280 [Thermosynechococcaceae cyanobacterium MS004]|nr:hypothetical protein [Thermosynechococcaceae cyanobacterium MS004]